MKISSIAIIVLALNATACTDIEVIPKGLIGDGGVCPNPTPPDLATAQPACEAARGLAGEAVVCEDFTGAKKPAPSVQALMGQGWEFSGTRPDCWQTSGGFLEVAGFKMFNTDCKFSPPTVDLKQTRFQNAQRVTLSLIHRVDLLDPEQVARIYIKDDNVGDNILYIRTGKQTAQRQQQIFIIQRNDPQNPGLSDVFKFILKMNTTATIASRNGWQIESLAVIVSP
jgi:hypothetical protein